MMMSEDEFDKLAADRNKLIVESSSLPDTIAPNPSSELIVDSSIIPQWTRLRMRGKLWWMRGRFSSDLVAIMNKIS
jgi:hypothetical protein